MLSSLSGDSRASVPILSTRLRSELCRTITSPFLAQQVAWSPKYVDSLLAQRAGDFMIQPGTPRDKDGDFKVFRSTKFFAVFVA